MMLRTASRHARPRERRGLALILLCAPILAAGCRMHEGGRWDWERMREQRRADLYGANATFPDGKVMQTPPEGTIPVDAVLGDAALTEGAVDGAPVREIPVPVTPALLAEGRERFGIFCSPCHGMEADGNGRVGVNMYPVRPPSLRTATVAAMPPGELYRIITMGLGRMPSFAPQLTLRDRWAVVAYLRSLPQAAAPAPVDTLHRGDTLTRGVPGGAR